MSKHRTPRTMQALLVVEDDADINRHLCCIMAKEGYHACPAHNRKEALAISPQPMLALLDMGLPPAKNHISEGLFLIDALLASEPRSKIIVITGHDEESAAFEAVRHGAFDFLKKPAPVSEIKSAIKRAALFLRHEASLSAFGETRLHLTVKLADGPQECADTVEEQIVRHTLSDTNGNVSEAARRLGLVRENLYYYLKKYGIQPNRIP